MTSFRYIINMTAPTTLLNFNVGVLGHVDSGKTSLSKALSTVASTASFDKNPQSKERGITLDLGFSSFAVDIPEHLKHEGLEKLQYTLVDCPGHASLIRTIIGGAQIIDLMILVVDVTKGMQTQTAECLVIGEIACERMMVVLNKVDLLPVEKRQTAIEKMTKRMQKTLESTKFAGSQVIPVAAKPGGPEAPDTGAEGIDKLIEVLKASTYKPKRDSTGLFIFSVDHCFSIRGQGTVMTGTALSGALNIKDRVEIPSMKVTKKVKSMQMFRKPVTSIIQGDRAGVCVTQFDPKQLERGLVCTPGALPTISAAIISVKKIPYYKDPVNTKAKFHITVGHETVMGRATFFGLYGHKSNEPDTTTGFNFEKHYLYQKGLHSATQGAEGQGSKAEEDEKLPRSQYAVLELEKPVTCSTSALVIGSKLDTDIHSNICRIAFHGVILEAISDLKYTETVLPKVKVFKNKFKEGIVERKADENSVVCRGLFKKETNIETFVGMKVKLSTGEQGSIEGGFGQSGKLKVRIPTGLSETTSQQLSTKTKKGKIKGADSLETTRGGETEPIKVTLAFKRFIYDPKKKMMQS